MKKAVFNALRIACIFLLALGCATAQSTATYDKLRARLEFKLGNNALTSIVTSITGASSNAQSPTAKAVWDLVQVATDTQMLSTNGLGNQLTLSGGGGTVEVDCYPDNDLTWGTTFSGDVDGNYNNLIVNRIRENPVSGDTPTDGQALVWNATEGWWKPTIINAGNYTEYVVPITGGNANTALSVICSATGVSAAYATGELTLTVPTNAVLLAVHWRGVQADIQSGADAGGAVNWVRLKVMGLAGNTGLANMRVPVVQKTIYAAGSPGLSAPFTINQGNNPNQSVVGVGSGSITIRFSGMAGATNGFMVTASGF